MSLGGLPEGLNNRHGRGVGLARQALKVCWLSAPLCFVGAGRCCFMLPLRALTATPMGYAITSVYVPLSCQKAGRSLTVMGKRVGCQRVEADPRLRACGMDSFRTLEKSEKKIISMLGDRW